MNSIYIADHFYYYKKMNYNENVFIPTTQLEGGGWGAAWRQCFGKETLEMSPVEMDNYLLLLLSVPEYTDLCKMPYLGSFLLINNLCTQIAPSLNGACGKTAPKYKIRMIVFRYRDISRYTWTCEQTQVELLRVVLEAGTTYFWVYLHRAALQVWLGFLY